MRADQFLMVGDVVYGMYGQFWATIIDVGDDWLELRLLDNNEPCPYRFTPSGFQLGTPNMEFLTDKYEIRNMGIR